MGLRGPKPWKPTEDQIEKIKLYAGLGSTQEQTARLIGICEDTLALQPEAKAAFEHGKAQTIAKVAGSLVKKALNGDTASAIFYLKTQAGWREKPALGDADNPIVIQGKNVSPQEVAFALARRLREDSAERPLLIQSDPVDV